LKKNILYVLLFLFIIIGGLVFFFFNKLNHVNIDKSDEALGISQSTPDIKNQQQIVDINSNNEEIKMNEDKNNQIAKENIEKQIAENNKINNNDVINIALFGVDSRTTKNDGRADSIMIATIDFKNKKIKLTSLMRDMYVKIDGHGSTKLNHSYAYGGPQLAIKTINQNFGTDIRDYITVNFFTLEKIINVIGGVNINIKKEEINMLNDLVRGTANIEKTKYTKITQAGEQLLDGQQAVAYARIRYIGNSDFERTERQRSVLSAMITKTKEKIKDVGVLANFISQVLPLVETSMDSNTILSLGMDYIKTDGLELEQERFPVNGYYWDDMSTGTYYLKFDKEKTKQQIFDYIFSDIRPIPKK